MVGRDNKPPRPRVVVIGGQFAGRRVKLLLDGKFLVTVVDAKGFFEYTPSVLRCLVHPDHIPRILLPHLSGTINAVVESLALNAGAQKGEAKLTDGTSLPFDYCVIASGSNYASPIKALPPSALQQDAIHQRAAELSAAAAALAAASSVVVIGGGYVGVELAAEIVGRFGSSKHVVLITSSQRLLERMPLKASNHATHWLTSRRVQIITNARVTAMQQDATAEHGKHSVYTSQGDMFPADLVYNCTGYTTLNTSVYASLLAGMEDAGGKLEEAGKRGIPVGSMLQVTGFERIFACGDAMRTVFEKTAYTADLSAVLAARNIQRLQAGLPLLSYPQDVVSGRASRPPAIAAVSLYKYDGIYQMNGLILTGLLAAAAKWFVEWMQLQVAHGSFFWPMVWLVIEQINTYLGGFMFTS